ncbi:septum site-determining protein MinC [Parendozoicomonas haliclonae]|uniref:Probable septum site-determining protein MinC n=2 Tax=Parendozoicomonas haliclonae TaxID=1960125 RepID=A0A1X7AQ11_9GAMM|nr:Septum site-determining protein MinC [Parendozoicomonas haliclonae]
MVTLMTLELYRYDENLLRQQFQGLLANAPRFFENTPVVVGLEHLHNPEDAIDLKRLAHLCAGFGINLIAIRGGNSQHRRSAAEAGLACLAAQPQAVTRKLPANAPQRNKTSSIGKNAKVTPIHQNEMAFDEQAGQQASAPSFEEPKVISTPVRSGQQVYHNGDLILTGPVSAGAEILAGGNIHAYGPFRGRALAGVNGNSKARIFCTHFEAELVSIHGHYKLAVSMDKSLWKKAVQVYMDQDSLILKRL